MMMFSSLAFSMKVKAIASCDGEEMYGSVEHGRGMKVGMKKACITASGDGLNGLFC
jgi:hypothetical protein